MKFVFLAWFALSVAIFMYVPGRVSYIHWENLANFPGLFAKLTRLDWGAYSLDLISAIFGIAILSIANASLGLFTLQKLNMEEKKSAAALSRLAYLSTALLIGYGILSTLYLFLAAIGHLTPGITIIVTSIGFLSGAGRLKNLIVSWAANKTNREPTLDKWQKTLRWLAICVLSLSVLYSSSRLSYDSTAVYFSDAKLTAMTNHIQYFTDDSFVVSVFQTAIEFSAITQVFGDQTARLFSWVCGLIIIIFSLALGEEFGLNRLARLILLILLVTSTAFLDLMGDGKVDLASSAPAVAAVYWMFLEQTAITPGKSRLVLIGLLAGLAMVARPFNVILVGGFTGLFYLLSIVRTNEDVSVKIKRRATSLLWIGAGALGFGILHLLANWIILGDPLAMLSNASKVDSSAWQWAFEPNQLLLIRLLYPFSVTFLNTPQSLGNISPLFIAFIPAVLATTLRSRIQLTRPAANLLISAITLLALWIFLFFTVVEIRYVFFLWIILFLPVSQWASATLAFMDTFLRNIFLGIIIGLLLFIALRILFISFDSYAPLDGQGNPQCYDSRFCEYLRPINQKAPTGAQVLALGAFRYYLRSDLFACSSKHEDYRILRELSYENPDVFWREVYRRGYQFIAYENDYTTRHLQFGLIPSPENTPPWLTLEPIYGKPGDLQIAYQIHTANPPLNAERICEMNNLDIWEIHSVSADN